MACVKSNLHGSPGTLCRKPFYPSVSGSLSTFVAGLVPVAIEPNEPTKKPLRPSLNPAKVSVRFTIMAQMRQDPRSRRISELEAEVASLRAMLTESERSLVELGLRLAQENEALRNELAELKKKVETRKRSNAQE